MNTAIWVSSIGLALLQLSLTGCSSVPFKSGAPAQAGAPAIYRAAQGIAIIAELNKSVASTAINLNKLGKLSDENTADVLGYSELVAQSCRSAALVIQDKTKSDASKMKAVLALTQQVSVPATLSSKLSLGSSDMISLSSLLNSMNMAMKMVVGILT